MGTIMSRSKLILSVLLTVISTNALAETSKCNCEGERCIPLMKPSALTGMLTSQQGRLVLQLPELTCFVGSGDLNLDGADGADYPTQSSIQLSLATNMDMNTASRNVGNEIEVAGRLYAWHTAWHIKPVIMDVTSFKVAPPASAPN